MPLSLLSLARSRGCQMCQCAATSSPATSPTSRNSNNIGRRWFCHTALYYFHLFPSSSVVAPPTTTTCRAMDLPRHFVVPPKGRSNGHKYFARSSFATQATTAKTATSIRGGELVEVLSALEQLVGRLLAGDDQWGPHNSNAAAAAAAAVTADPTSNASSNKSVEEYARIFCKGYNDLPPLQLGWIATNASPSLSSFITTNNNNNNWECPRSAILFFLAQNCGLPNSVAANDNASNSARAAWSSWVQDFKNDDDNTQSSTSMTTINSSVLKQLRQAWTPPFEHVFQCLLEQNSKQTIPMLVKLRGDLLRLMAVLPTQPRDQQEDQQQEHQAVMDSMQQLEHYLRRLLSTWFSPGMLDIQRITFNTTSAGVIEKIAVKEAVHPMKSLDDLRRRLGPKRRVFALFHPLLPEEPLVILHVHLESKADNIPATMTHVLTEDDDQTKHISSPRIATFYSISNTQPGLTRGLGLGEFLIKGAVQLLQNEFPSSLETFVTLSPLPGFRKWVEGIVGDEENGQNDEEWAQKFSESSEFTPDMIQAVANVRPQLRQLLQSTKATDAVDNDKLHPTSIEQQLEELKPLLVSLAAHYLVLAKNLRSGKPLDPVAGFHIHNGAEVHRINFAADLSRKGLLRSFGVMANYRYRLDYIETNKASFESSYYSLIAMSDGVKDLIAK